MIAAQAARGFLLRLFLSKAELDQIPTLGALGSGALLELAAATGALALELHGRKLDVEFDLVVVTQRAVDIGRSDLAGVDGADDRRRTGLAVAAAVQAVETGNGAVLSGNDTAAVDLYAQSLKRSRLDILADCDEDTVGLNQALGGRCSAGSGATAARSADDLRLDDDAGRLTLGVDIYAHGSMELHDLAAFRLGAGNLGILGGHIANAAAIDDGNGLGTKADAGPGHVHGDVAAANNHDALPGQVGGLAVTDGAKQLDRGLDAGGVFARKTELLVGMGADGQVDRIVLGSQTLELDGVDAVFKLDVDAAGKDPVDFLLQSVDGQAIARDTVAQHATKALALLEDGHLMTHDGQVIRCRESGGAAADDGHALAGGICDGRAVILFHMLGGVALESKDVHRVVYHATATVHLTGMLAHQTAHDGEWVILANDLDSVGVAASLDEADIRRDVHVSGATGYARHLLRAIEAACTVLDVVLEVIPETLDGGKRHATRLVADGAVAGPVDRLCRTLYQVQRVLVRAVVQNIIEQISKSL